MEPITIKLIVAIAAIAVILIYWLKSKESVSIEELYANALGAIIYGNNAEAIKLLKQVVNQDSDKICAYVHLGNLLRSTNPQQAVKIHQSLTIRPKLKKEVLSEIHQALALDYAEMSNYNRARIEAERVLKNDKNSLWANQFLLNIAEVQHEWERASDLTQKLQKLTDKKDVRQLAQIQLQAGTDQQNLGENKKALKRFFEAIKLDPTFSSPYLEIGNIYEKDDNPKKALLYWEKYLVTEELGDPKIYKKVKSTLFDLGRFNELERFYSRILNAKPNDKNALIKLANLLKDKGDLTGAVELVDTAINKNNEFIQARLMKIKILLETANKVDLNNQIDELLDILGK